MIIHDIYIVKSIRLVNAFKQYNKALQVFCDSQAVVVDLLSNTYPYTGKLHDSIELLAKRNIVKIEPTDKVYNYAVNTAIYTSIYLITAMTAC